MSDLGRKDMSDSLKDKVTPDSSKSTADKAGDSVTGKLDKAARDIVPDSQKSTSQEAKDKVGRTADAHKPESEKSMLDKTKDAVGLGK